MHNLTPLRGCCRAAVALGLLVLCAAGARADDWPRWLGPRGDSIWRETGILDKFPKGGPKVLWRLPLGGGYTGPSVVAQRVYVMDFLPAKDAEKPNPNQIRALKGTERVLCLDTANGKEIWKHEYPCIYRISYATGPRTTPVVAGGKVYTLGAMGDLLCLDAAKGKVLWSKNFVNELKARVPIWGWSATPLLDGNRLYCLAGGDGSAMVALDKDSGKVLWKSLSSVEVGYAPPVLATGGGKRQLIVWLSDSVSGLDPENGKPYWTRPYPDQGPPRRPAVTIATPRIAGDLLFLSSFYHGSLMLRLDKDKPGTSVVWKSKRAPEKADALNVVMMTPFFKDGYLYGVSGEGQLRCLKAETGEEKWETLQPATGGKKTFLATAFLIEQGNRFFLFNDEGDLIIARLAPKGYEEIDRAHVIATSQEAFGRPVVWSHPACAGRCMFIRNDKEMVCLSLAAEKP
jgi:outer membrane protein assembly factor BamB